jgi:hypothetical protein
MQMRKPLSPACTLCTVSATAAVLGSGWCTTILVPIYKRGTTRQTSPATAYPVLARTVACRVWSSLPPTLESSTRS